MIINGILVKTKEKLEEVIAGFDDDSKTGLRLIFDEENALTIEQKYLEQYKKRAAVKDKIMSEIATENIGRVLQGIWTESDLVALTTDFQLKDILDDLSTLSYEIAYSKVDGITNELITQEIKDGWKAKLAQYFYPVM